MTEDFIQENEDRELFRRIKQGSEEAGYSMPWP